MSLPTPLKDDPIPLSIGGQHFAVKRSVLTAEPDSMLGAMFSGEWNQANGGTDESGVRKLKGVRPELFKLLLEHYLEPRALEHAYELDAKPHPMVRGPRAEEYRRMLKYLGLDKATEKTHGTHDKFDTDVLLGASSVTLTNDNRTFSPCVSATQGLTFSHYTTPHKIGVPSELRLQLRMGEGVREQPGENALVLWLSVHFLPVSADINTAENWRLPTSVGGGNVSKSHTHLQALFGKNIFENSIVKLSVTADNAVWIALEGAEGEEENFCLGVGVMLKEGTYRYLVGLDRPGVRATILPPVGTAVMTV